MAHEQFQELLAVHAVSALDETEASALNEHLLTCATCRADLDQWRRTSSALAFMSTPAEPSPKVREQILAQVRAEKATQTTPAERASTPANVVPFVDRRRRVPRSFGSFEAIAAVIIVALLISVFVLWRQNQATKAEIAKLTEDIRNTEVQLAHQREIVEMMSKPGAKMIELAGTNLASSARATIVYDRNGTAMLMAKGLPAAPSGMVYQLWFIVADKPMPGKTFGTDPSGNGDMHDQIPSVAMEGAVFAVTMEPAGGRPSPSGKMFLVSRS